MNGSRSTARTAGAVSSTPLLQRRPGALDGAALVVSNVIGGGIFFTPVFVPISFFPFALSPSKGVLPFSDSLRSERSRRPWP